MRRCKSCTVLFKPKWGRKQKYCDRRCANWALGGKSKVSCVTCGTIVVRTHSKIKRNNNNYCSRKCIRNVNLVKEAKNLRELGLSYRKIANLMEIGKTTAMRYVKEF
jgi:hypothetical protein